MLGNKSCKGYSHASVGQFFPEELHLPLQPVVRSGHRKENIYNRALKRQRPNAADVASSRPSLKLAHQKAARNSAAYQSSTTEPETTSLLSESSVEEGNGHSISEVEKPNSVVVSSAVELGPPTKRDKRPRHNQSRAIPRRPIRRLP